MEQRLIDANELKKRAYPFPCAIGSEYAVSLRQINDTATIDPVHAAGACYCEECKNSELQKVVGNGIDEPPYIAGLFCRKFGLFPMKDNDFCSYGERREE